MWKRVKKGGGRLVGSETAGNADDGCCLLSDPCRPAPVSDRLVGCTHVPGYGIRKLN